MVNWREPTALPIDPFGSPDTGFATMRVTSPWGTRDNPLNPGQQVFHGGLDIGNARLGDHIVAAADGVVVDAGVLGLPWSQPSSPTNPATPWPERSYGGNMVIVAHDGPWVSLYAHMQPDLVVAKGQPVQAGATLGKVGESGAAMGRGHLHFGIINRSAAAIIQAGILIPNAWTVDPWPLISEDPMEWFGQVHRIAPFIVRFTEPQNIFAAPNRDPANIVRELPAGATRVIIGTTFSDQLDWDVFLASDGPPRCYPTRRRGTVTPLLPPQPDGGVVEVDNSGAIAKIVDAKADLDAAIGELQP